MRRGPNARRAGGVMTLRAGLVLMMAMAAGSLGAEARPTTTGLPEPPSD